MNPSLLFPNKHTTMKSATYASSSTTPSTHTQQKPPPWTLPAWTGAWAAPWPSPFAKPFLTPSSLPYILLQRHPQKRLEFISPSLRILQRRRRRAIDAKQRLQRRLVKVGRLSLGHFECGNASAPHIDGHAVSAALNQFWSHPERRAHHRATLLVLAMRL